MHWAYDNFDHNYSQYYYFILSEQEFYSAINDKILIFKHNSPPTIFGYIDVGDGWWIRNVLVTTIRCWWRSWPFWSPRFTFWAPRFTSCHQHHWNPIVRFILINEQTSFSAYIVKMMYATFCMQQTFSLLSYWPVFISWFYFPSFKQTRLLSKWRNWLSN